MSAVLIIMYYFTADKSIFVDGLPPIRCVRRCSSSKSATSKSEHEAATVTVNEFRQLEDMEPVRTDCGPPIIWLRSNKMVKAGRQLQWSSESALTDYVKTVLEDVINEAGLLSCLFCETEMSLFDAQRPDILLICAFGFPIGFIEVKKPGSMHDPKIHGQIFDYLTYIRTYMGRRQTFGILTSYNEWRIIWMPDTQDLALTTLLPESFDPDCIPGPSAILPTEPPNWSVDETPFLHHDEEIEVQPTPRERTLFGTDVIQWNDRRLPHLLISCIKKMMSSPMNPIAPLRLVPNRSYIYVANDNWRWEKVSEEKELVIEGSSAPSYFQHAFLLADLGGGAEGRAWLAATKQGKVCVIKFSDDKGSLECEAEVWNKAWPQCKVKVKQLNRRWGLVMPWVKPCSVAEFEDPGTKEAVKKAVEQLVKIGYCHDDLHLRHVGLYREKGIVNALLFDFGRVTKITKNPEVDSLAYMMEQIKNTK